VRRSSSGQHAEEGRRTWEESDRSSLTSGHEGTVAPPRLNVGNGHQQAGGAVQQLLAQQLFFFARIVVGDADQRLIARRLQRALHAFEEIDEKGIGRPGILVVFADARDRCVARTGRSKWRSGRLPMLQDRDSFAVLRPSHRRIAARLTAMGSASQR
jgi:hypothetical protein